LQYKNKKNLYKILFITILLVFIISLAGCNWLSLGLLNIFDPQAQIRIDYNPEGSGEPAEGCCNVGVSCINGVEFYINGFTYNYYGVDYIDGNIEISELSRVMEASFYVAPSTSPGTPGPKTIIKNIPLFFQDALDYLFLHPFVTEVTCDLSLVGVDGSGHSLSFQIVSELPIFEPGIDFYSPNAVITTNPELTTGIAPFTIIFDASESNDFVIDVEGNIIFGSGIASITWDFGDGTFGTEITETHTYNNPGAYSVILTVTDFYGNIGYDTVTIIANEPEAPTAAINTTPADISGIVNGSAPFEVYFDAYNSESEAEIISYAWDFGDGSLAIGITTNHTYSNIGTYTAILTVTDSNGKKGYASVDIEVVKAPEAVINTTPDPPPTGTVPFTVYFDAYGSTSESGIVSYKWNFGDGSSGGTGITTNHTYTVVGTYTVILTIIDSNGYEAYDSVDVTVEECECPE